MRQLGSPATKSRPIRNACASPPGSGCAAYLNLDSPLRSAAEQLLKAGLILGRGDDQKLGDAGEHQRRQRVINHRLVVNRQQLLRHRRRHRIQPRARAAGENDSLVQTSSVSAAYGVTRSRFARRAIAPTTAPKTNPPTCAHQAMPATSCVRCAAAIERKPLKNCMANQIGRKMTRAQSRPSPSKRPAAAA